MRSLLKKLKTINTNSVVAGSALFISACALFLSIQEIRIMRTQQQASMYPYLTTGWTYNGEGFGIELKNSGNGLAKINSYKVKVNDLYFKDWIDIIKHVMPDAQNINYGIIGTSGNIRDQMISPGETKQLIFIKWTDETRQLERKVRSLNLSICYESLLNEYWYIKDDTPVKMEEPCEINEEEEFGS